jgi:hypothetical protein
MTGRGRARQPGGNKLERDYGARLDADPNVVWHKYEGITLKLAHDTRYTPDYAVMLADGTIELHECKGPHAWEDSIVKLRCAAEMFPFVFWIARRDKEGAWDVQQVGETQKRALAKPFGASFPAGTVVTITPPSTSQKAAKWKPGEPIPRGFALLDGKLVTEASARKVAGLP